MCHNVQVWLSQLPVLHSHQWNDFSWSVAVTSRPQANPSKECLKELEGAGYRGTTSETHDGRQCLPWNSETRHVYAAEKYAETHDLKANYCRNPSRAPTVWCYTANYEAKLNGQPYYGYCKVPSCNSKFDNYCSVRIKAILAIAGRPAPAWKISIPTTRHTHWWGVSGL